MRGPRKPTATLWQLHTVVRPLPSPTPDLQATPDPATGTVKAVDEWPPSEASKSSASSAVEATDRDEAEYEAEEGLQEAKGGERPDCQEDGIDSLLMQVGEEAAQPEQQENELCHEDKENDQPAGKGETWAGGGTG